jgi:HD superfamily phosphohydrolase
MTNEERQDSANPYRGLGDADDLKKVKTFTIPVSGSVVLFGPEIAAVATPEFQRLAGVKQLGTSYIVYRGALHTRFEHSLGSLHQAELMLRAIEANPRDPYPIEPAARRLARLGSLLHDLPHVPFGHTLEDEFHLLQRHDKNEHRVRSLLVDGDLGAVLRGALGDDEFEELQAVLLAKEDEDFAKLRYPFVGDIVGNTVCADMLDYVERDLLACGLPAAVGERFLDYLSVTGPDEGLDVDHGRLVLNMQKGGMPRPDVESEVGKLLSFRYELAERVYFHHAKNAASVMIGRAVHAAGFATGPDTPPELDENFWWVSDDLLLEALANPDVADALTLKRANDVDLDLDLASDLATRVLKRDLYKIAYLATWDDLPDAINRIDKTYREHPQRLRQLEDSLASDAGLERGHVLVHIPRSKMMSKNADVRVRAGSDVVKLHEWDKKHSHRLEALNAAHERLWRVMVYVHPDHEHAKDIVRAAAMDQFGAANRYGDSPRGSEYKRALFDSLSERWTLAAVDIGALDAAAYSEGSGRAAAEREILAAVRASRRRSGAPPLRRS